MGVKRGDLITVALQGAYGKPRPALVIQSDNFDEHPSVTILPVTSTLIDAPLFRVMIEPFPETNLEKPSQVMIDKTMTLPKEKAGAVFGKLDYTTMQQVDRCLALFLGIAK
nr:type II toxin-antitoxin system PemK/MazF family toxin [Photorhabdus sp. RW14-46]